MTHIYGTGLAETEEDDGGTDSGIAGATASSNSALAFDWPSGGQQQGGMGPTIESSGLELDSGDSCC